MAERFPEPAAVVMDPVEVAINSRFDELVHTVNRRRVELLLEYRERRDEMRARETGLIRTKQQLLQAKEQLHDKNGREHAPLSEREDDGGNRK